MRSFGQLLPTHMQLSFTHASGAVRVAMALHRTEPKVVREVVLELSSVALVALCCDASRAIRDYIIPQA